MESVSIMPRKKSAQAKAIDLRAINKAVFLCLLTVAIYMLLANMAMASGLPAGTNSPMGDVMCRVVYFIYGNLGRGMATIAIIILGVGATLGKVSWGLAITVAVGISVIFNAETIASLMLTGGTSATFCP
jgi:type IV secretory pathway VirB2 component (pilin)